MVCQREIINIGNYFKKAEGGLCYKCLNHSYKGINSATYQDLSFSYLHYYDDEYMSYLIKFKGLYDGRYQALLVNKLAYRALKRRYHDYILIGMPSFIDDDIKRGFNHVEELFRGIGKAYISPLYKKSDHKQAISIERKKIKNSLRLKADFNLECLKNQKILLVDDVLTSGATLNTAINLLQLNEYEILVCLWAKQKADLKKYVEIRR